MLFFFQNTSCLWVYFSSFLSSFIRSCSFHLASPCFPFPCPFLSSCFHPSFSPVVTPSSSSVSIPPPVSLPLCNQSRDWAVFTGSSQGPASVTHSLYNRSPRLTLHSLALLWSDYRRSDRKTLPPLLLYPSLKPPASTSHTPAALLQQRQTGRRPSYLSAQMEPRHSGHRGCTSWLDHKTGTWSFNTDWERWPAAAHGEKNCRRCSCYRSCTFKVIYIYIYGCKLEKLITLLMSVFWESNIYFNEANADISLKDLMSHECKNFLTFSSEFQTPKNCCVTV